MRAMPDPFHDIGPDEDMDLTEAEPVEFPPDFRIELVVAFTSAQLTALSELAREHGIHEIQAVQLLVDEALAARARAAKPPAPRRYASTK